MCGKETHLPSPLFKPLSTWGSKGALFSLEFALVNVSRVKKTSNDGPRHHLRPSSLTTICIIPSMCRSIRTGSARFELVDRRVSS